MLGAGQNRGTSLSLPAATSYLPPLLDRIALLLALAIVTSYM